jgi:hypothetical protein
MCRLRLGVLCGWSPAEVELDRERQAGFSRANFRVACYHLHRRPHQRPGFARRPAPTRTRDASTKLLPFGANDICQPRADLTAISCAAAALTVCRLAAASIRGASARTGGAVTCAAAGRDSGSVFGGVLLVGHRFLLVSFSASCALKRADVHRPETLQCPRHKQKKRNGRHADSGAAPRAWPGYGKSGFGLVCQNNSIKNCFSMRGRPTQQPATASRMHSVT